MRETRIFAAPVEVRGEADGEAEIEGYAATFDEPYEVWGFTESISPKAFNKTLRERKDELAVVWSHDADRVLGTVASGTAWFATDERGLKYGAKLDLLDPDGVSAYRKVRTGKVTKSSFAFEPVKDRWEEREGEMPHRTILEARLYEASPVLWPANPATEVDVKRAVASYAEYRGLDPEAWDLSSASIEDIRAATGAAVEEPATTTEPEPEPETHSEPTPEPEQVRKPRIHLPL